MNRIKGYWLVTFFRGHRRRLRHNNNNNNNNNNDDDDDEVEDNGSLNSRITVSSRSSRGICNI